MAKKRRFTTCETEQHSQPFLSHGSPNRAQSCGASQPTQPHGSSQTTHLPRASQPHHLPRASQPHHLPRTSRPSNSHSSSQPHEAEEDLDVQANEQFREQARRSWHAWYMENNLPLPNQLHYLSHPTPSRGASQVAKPQTTSQDAQPQTNSQVQRPHGSLQHTQSNAPSQNSSQGMQGISRAPSRNSSQPQNVEDNFELDHDLDEPFAEREVGIQGSRQLQWLPRSDFSTSTSRIIARKS